MVTTEKKTVFEITSRGLFLAKNHEIIKKNKRNVPFLGIAGPLEPLITNLTTTTTTKRKEKRF